MRLFKNGAELGRVTSETALFCQPHDGMVRANQSKNKGRLYLVAELWLFFRCVNCRLELPCVSAKHHGNDLRRKFALEAIQSPESCSVCFLVVYVLVMAVEVKKQRTGSIGSWHWLLSPLRWGSYRRDQPLLRAGG
jgi:hypothetical protein